MTIYFSTNQISVLDTFSNREKQAIMALALSKFTVPQKLIVNLLKLCMLIPPFLYLANLEMVMFTIAVVIVFAAYVLIMRPVCFWFAQEHLEQAIKIHASLKDDE